MDIQSVMTSDPRCCIRSTLLIDVARMMRDEDVGEIPVVEDAQSLKLVGVITDRDIVVRSVANGDSLGNVTAGDCMTAPATSVEADASLDDCAQLMASGQIRRVPVVNANGAVCGIVSQADVQATQARSLKEAIADRVSVPH